jgi:DNA-binding transcriptional LysR family regulator
VLVEPSGRRLQLTPAGRALLPHARTVIATLDAARGELEAGAAPVGHVRVAGFATALIAQVVPAVRELVHRYPEMSVTMEECEPDEVAALMARDAVDVGLVYEYSLVPRGTTGSLFVEVPMALVIPDGETRSLGELMADPAIGWITNSRSRDDDELIRRVGASFGARPVIAHRIDSLDLVVQLVAAGLGVALIAGDGPRGRSVRYVDVEGVAGRRTGYAFTRPGREAWPANAALIEAITTR